jgi:hypothetical protein
MGSPLSLAGQEVGVRAAVEMILEGMRTADSEMVRGVFASEARFAIIDRRAGEASRWRHQPLRSQLDRAASGRRRMEGHSAVGYAEARRLPGPIGGAVRAGTSRATPRA